MEVCFGFEGMISDVAQFQSIPYPIWLLMPFWIICTLILVVISPHSRYYHMCEAKLDGSTLVEIILPLNPALHVCRGVWISVVSG
jgi:hypothetical protein